MPVATVVREVLVPSLLSSWNVTSKQVINQLQCTLMTRCQEHTMRELGCMPLG